MEKKKLKFKESLSTKIAVMTILMVVICAVVVGVFGYALYRSDSIKSSAEYATGIAQSVAAAVDADGFGTFAASAEKDEYWDSLKSYLSAVKTDTDIQYLYIMAPAKNGGVMYAVEGQKPGDILDDIGQLGDMAEDGSLPEEFMTALSGGAIQATGVYDAGEFGNMVSGYAPVRDANGKVIGVAGADISVDDVMRDVNMFGWIIVAIIAGISVACCFIAIRFLRRNVGDPINEITDASHKMAEGDMDVDFNFTSEDEIGKLISSFKEMVESTRQQAEALERVANGDLTVHVEKRGDQDTMSMAMQKMIKKLREMVSSISTGTEQVSMGSKQIADGATMLAQGSVEQTTVVQELSHAIEDVTDQTKANAEKAEKAAALAEQIKANAEKGSGQMDMLIKSVNEINDASDAINKIIKVIDDIAFQTNILALNAAVEAARAGEHGKGFAVVADEVRNLAAKSAEAAKETGHLINNTIDKAEEGVRMAKVTSESLSDIVTGINESNEIIGEIASTSVEQRNAIEQINDGIDNVSKVVQQNSATAEESAAASQEMSGQSQMLNDLVSKFKVR